MILRLGESGNFLFARYDGLPHDPTTYTVEIGIARSTGLWYYQIRTINEQGVWSNVVVKDDCKDFEEAFEKTKVSLTLVTKTVRLGFHSLDLMHVKREEFEKIDWAKELA